MTGYWAPPRPYIEGQRFTPAERYWRPNLRLSPWFFLPPEVKAATLWSVAATATTILAGIRIWRAIVEPHDETGD